MSKLEVLQDATYATIIEQAVTALQNGQLVVAPTETRYGLLVNASDSVALEKLYQTKQRPGFMPTAIFVNSIEQIFEYGYQTNSAKILADAYLPGPLTLILKAKKEMEKHVVYQNKIGVRFSSSKLIADILAQIDFPLSATSANISGQNECVSIDEIQNELADNVSLYIDDGKLESLASTVVDVSEKELCFHRVGAISKEQIILKVES